MNTYIRISLIFWYLWACIRYKVIPWHYFQLNSTHFNNNKKIFSKLDMDALIPERIRLKQYYYNKKTPPVRYPVFIKPEWGQNSKGIIRVNNTREYKTFHSIAENSDMPFIVQDAALEKKEFELYYLRSRDNSDDYAFLSITEVTNRCKNHHPINSIRNPCTRYLDITQNFCAKELQTIWLLIEKIGKFRMARIGLKANNINKLLQGDFHIMEINLFLPMPLALLAQNIDIYKKIKIIKTTMLLSARLVKIIPKNETERPIFFQKMKAHYRVKE